MNVSYFLSNLSSRHQIPLNIQKQEARIQFFNEYPGIEYDEKNDAYRYRGFEFDYYCVGLDILGEGAHGDYRLVDKYDSDNILPRYGDRDLAWRHFLKNTTQPIRSFKDTIRYWRAKLDV